MFLVLTVTFAASNVAMAGLELIVPLLFALETVLEMGPASLQILVFATQDGLGSLVKQPSALTSHAA